MRIQRQRRVFLALPGALLLTALVITGCDDEDVGEPCGTDPTDVVPMPIDGEEPVTEIVRLERDRACETFQCITHSGLNPYCTQNCELDESTLGDECQDDRDCDPVFGEANGQKYCINGNCVDDDCPNGFACRELQDVGTLADQMFCVRQSGCETNLDCEEVGEIECRQLGCLDSCLLDQEALNVDLDTNQSTCAPDALNQFTCQPFDSLGCECQGGATDCEDAALSCTPQGLSAPWPENSVIQRGVCFGVDQDLPQETTN